MDQEPREVSAISRETPALEPVAARERFSSLDILRGFAVLGILLMNITSFGFPRNGMRDLAAASGWDPNLTVWVTTSVLFEGKMRALFSMLFGVGIVLFTLRAEDREGVARGGAIFYRRTLWLLAFGFLHAAFFWTGDILYEYAVGALLLYPLRKLSPTLLIVCGMGLLVIASLRTIPRNWELEQRRTAAAEANAAQRAGATLTAEQLDAQAHWAALMRFRQPNDTQIAREIADYQRGYWSIFVMRQRLLGFSAFISSWDTAAMMLIGMGLMKLGVFSAALGWWTYAAIMVLGYAAGFAINGITAYRTIAGNFEPIGMWWNLTTYDIGRLTMALGHVGLIILIFKAGRMRWLTSALAAVGQMALTNYLMQTVICTTIFYGYGFGLYGQLQRYQLYYVVLGVWIFQLLLSPLWLRYFAFGPMEWLWRSLTYGKLQPMRKPASVPVTGESVEEKEQRRAALVAGGPSLVETTAQS
jgi:uncharacterized protein